MFPNVVLSSIARISRLVDEDVHLLDLLNCAADKQKLHRSEPVVTGMVYPQWLLHKKASGQQWNRPQGDK